MTDRGAQPDELSALLVGLLAAIDSGEMSASAATRYRIEGAVAALDVLAGADSRTVLARLGVESETETDA